VPSEAACRAATQCWERKPVDDKFGCCKLVPPTGADPRNPCSSYGRLWPLRGRRNKLKPQFENQLNGNNGFPRRGTNGYKHPYLIVKEVKDPKNHKITRTAMRRNCPPKQCVMKRDIDPKKLDQKGKVEWQKLVKAYRLLEAKKAKLRRAGKLLTSSPIQYCQTLCARIGTPYFSSGSGGGTSLLGLARGRSSGVVAAEGGVTPLMDMVQKDYRQAGYFPINPGSFFGKLGSLVQPPATPNHWEPQSVKDEWKRNWEVYMSSATKGLAQLLYAWRSGVTAEAYGDVSLVGAKLSHSNKMFHETAQKRFNYTHPKQCHLDRKRALTCLQAGVEGKLSLPECPKGANMHALKQKAESLQSSYVNIADGSGKCEPCWNGYQEKQKSAYGMECPTCGRCKHCSGPGPMHCENAGQNVLTKSPQLGAANSACEFRRDMTKGGVNQKVYGFVMQNPFLGTGYCKEFPVLGNGTTHGEQCVTHCFPEVGSNVFPRVSCSRLCTSRVLDLETDTTQTCHIHKMLLCECHSPCARSNTCNEECKKWSCAVGKVSDNDHSRCAEKLMTA